MNTSADADSSITVSLLVLLSTIWVSQVLGIISISVDVAEVASFDAWMDHLMIQKEIYDLYDLSYPIDLYMDVCEIFADLDLAGYSQNQQQILSEIRFAVYPEEGQASLVDEGEQGDFYVTHVTVQEDTVIGLGRHRDVLVEVENGMFTVELMTPEEIEYYYNSY